MPASPDHDQTLASFFFSCLSDLQPSVAHVLCGYPSLRQHVAMSSALFLGKMAQTMPLSSMHASTRDTTTGETSTPSTAPPTDASDFTLDSTEERQRWRIKDDTEACATISEVVEAMPAHAFNALRAAGTGAGSSAQVSLVRRLAVALAQHVQCADTASSSSCETRSVSPGPAAVLCEGLDTELRVLVLLSALWLSAKFWLPAIQRVSLNSLLLHMTEHLEALTTADPDRASDDGRAPEEIVLASDLLGPPPMDNVGHDGLVVGSALRFESSDLRGGSSSDWIPAAAEAMEAVEMMLLRCCEYTVPLPAALTV